MQIIPVIDLKNNIVVHAKLGERGNYQPINTPLCASAVIYDVIRAFLSLYPFDTFYIADLDAITRQGHHDGLIRQVMDCFPNLTFWVDKGRQTYRQNQPKNYLPVLGSECYQDNNDAGELRRFRGEFILSLDYAIGGALGAPQLFTDTSCWPERIIVMSLARVGSGQGPDTDKLEQFLAMQPNKQFIAAGGIRHGEDLYTLAQLDIKQALVASALHSGAITRNDIEKLQAKKYPGKPGY